MTAAAATAFLWGKLPAHGDFVTRGLDGEARDALDLWLSGDLQAARDQLGEEFEACYDEAPPWRFRWHADGAGWSAGAMAPSMDSVGRRYPVLIGQNGLNETETLAVAAASENRIYSAFTGGWTADRLLDEAALPSEVEGDEGLQPPPPPTEGWWTLGGDHYPPRSLGGTQPPKLWHDILARSEGTIL